MSLAILTISFCLVIFMMSCHSLPFMEEIESFPPIHKEAEVRVGLDIVNVEKVLEETKEAKSLQEKTE